MMKTSNLLKSRKILYGIISFPVIFLALLLCAKSVNVPFYDQWEMVPIIEHVKSGHFYMTDFWWQHNEHRLLLPQLIMLGTAMVTDWNTKFEIAISLVFAVLSFGLVLKMITKDKLGALVNDSGIALLAIMASVIWFSPVQMENWLWGWQLQWFLNVLGVVMVAYGLSILKKANPTNRQLTIIVTGCLLAQYSLANGLLIWPIAILGLLHLKVSFKKIVLITATGVLSTALYYRHYVNTSEASQTLGLQEPIKYIHYVLIYLGRPLSYIDKFLPIIGLILVILFVGIGAYLYVHERNRFTKLVPWFALGLYALGSAAVTGLGRLDLGLDQAYSSRYTTISSLLLLSVVMIVYESRDHIKILVKENYTTLARGTLVVLVVLLASGYVWGVRNAAVQSLALKDIKACTKLTNPTRECLLSTYPRDYVVRPRLEYLKQIHWGGY